jgi:glycine cleavage system H protein
MYRTTTARQIPPGLLYSGEGIWVKTGANDQARIGITYHLYNILTAEAIDVDIKVTILPVGTKLNRFDAFGTMESIKLVLDLVSPVSGTIAEANPFYSGDVAYIPPANYDMYGSGWMVIIKMSDPSELKLLLSAKDYEATYSVT